VLIKKPDGIRSSEITPEGVYRDRRRFMAGIAAAGAALVGGCKPGGGGVATAAPASSPPAAPDLVTAKSPFSTDEKQTSFSDVTSYNNFYEFGIEKTDPAKYAPKLLRPRPWTIAIDGEVAKPATVGIDDLLKAFTLEERVYRHRCVEAWSMVVPWAGFALGDFLKKYEPTSKAKYVTFATLKDPEQMPGQKTGVLEWPYLEGLRIDEAMNPLAILCVGLYGKALPAQNGAPVRLVVPWKYGFKSIKSIVKITLTESRPKTAWNDAAPDEYGFFSNVNPKHDHPRWSQAKERRIGEFSKRETLMFNGYADQVASLYAGMDLDKDF
jgi:sulfoxide reductase catalytic subunit YedY